MYIKYLLYYITNKYKIILIKISEILLFAREVNNTSFDFN